MGGGLMSVGSRVQHLLDSHGHSYAQADQLTGVSRETIRRICIGHNPPKLRFYLRKVAQGYGIDELSLLEGASPKGEFEWIIRHAAPGQRLEWALMTRSQRVKVTLDFLMRKYPEKVTTKLLASACGRPELAICTLLARWRVSPPDRRTADLVAEAIHGLTEIPVSWFRSGQVAGQWVDPLAGLPRVSRFLQMARSASASEGVAALQGMVGH